MYISAKEKMHNKTKKSPPNKRKPRIYILLFQRLPSPMHHMPVMLSYSERDTYGKRRKKTGVHTEKKKKEKESKNATERGTRISSRTCIMAIGHDRN
jgi:hypothetical protein